MEGAVVVLEGAVVVLEDEAETDMDQEPAIGKDFRQ
jgi:hypothetical protein